jgi:hypothetical protein
MILGWTCHREVADHDCRDQGVLLLQCNSHLRVLETGVCGTLINLALQLRLAELILTVAGVFCPVAIDVDAE